MSGNLNVGSVYVKADIEDKTFQSKANGMKNKLNEIGNNSVKALSGAFMKMGAAIAVAFSVKAISNFISKSQELFEIQDRAEKKMSALMKNAGIYTFKNIEEMKKYAGELQKITNYGDESILPIISNLSKAKLSTEQLKEATKQYLNLQTAGVSGEQLSKILEKPVEMADAARRMNIFLNKELMKTLSLEEQRAYVLDEINKKYGGLAEAMAEPDIQFKNVIGDIKEKIGSMIDPISDTIFSVMLKDVIKLDEKIGDFTSKVNKSGSILNTVVNGFIINWESLKYLLGFIKEEFISIINYAKKLFNIKFDENSLSNFVMIISGSVNTLKLFIGTAKIAIKDLIDFITRFGTIVDDVKNAFESLRSFVSVVWESIVEVISQSVETAKAGVMVLLDPFHMAERIEEFKDSLGKTKEIIKKNGEELFKSGKDVAEKTGKLIKDTGEQLVFLMGGTGIEIIQDIIKKIQSGELATGTKELYDTIMNAINSTQVKVKKEVEDGNGNPENSIDIFNIDSFITKLEDLTQVNEIDEISTKIKELRKELKKLEETSKKEGKIISEEDVKRAEELIAFYEKILIIKKNTESITENTQNIKGVNALSQLPEFLKWKDQLNNEIETRKENIESLKQSGTATNEQITTLEEETKAMEKTGKAAKSTAIKMMALDAVLQGLQAAGQGLSESYQRQIENTSDEEVKKKLAEKSQEAAEGMSILSTAISQFMSGKFISGTISMVTKLISLMAKYSIVFGKIFEWVGKTINVFGKLLGILTDIFMGIVPIASILDIIYYLLDGLSVILNLFGQAIEIAMWPFKWLANMFSVLIRAFSNWGKDADVGGLKAQEKRQKDLETQIKDKEEQLSKLNEQVDTLKGIKSTLKSMLDIQDDLLQLEINREKRQWDTKTNAAMYKGLIDNLKRTGAVRSDFDFSLYEQLLNPDGTVNVDLGEKLLKMLKFDQMDAQKIYDSSAKSQLENLIDALIGNQTEADSDAQKELDLRQSYTDLQNDLNTQLKDLGYSTEELGYNFNAVVNQLKKMSFDEFKLSFRDTVMSLTNSVGVAADGVISATNGLSSALVKGISPSIIELNNFRTALGNMVSQLNYQITTKIKETETATNTIQSDLLKLQYQARLTEIEKTARKRALDAFNSWAGISWADWAPFWTADAGWIKRTDYVNQRWYAGYTTSAEVKEMTELKNKLATMHTGGLVSNIDEYLKSDEVLRILQKGEYVINKKAMSNPDISKTVDFINKNNILPDIGNNINNKSNINISVMANDYYELFQQISKKMSEYGKGIQVIDL